MNNHPLTVRRIKTKRIPILTTTPRRITPAVLEFCKELEGSDANPIYTPVVDSMPMNMCFRNVPQKITSEGGSEVIGWTIWEYPGMFLVAEFHCNWEKDGKIVDVTRKQDNERQILFLPSFTRKWEGVRVENIRKALTTAPCVQQLFEAEHTFEKLMPAVDKSPDLKSLAKMYLIKRDVIPPIMREIYHVYSSRNRE